MHSQNQGVFRLLILWFLNGWHVSPGAACTAQSFRGGAPLNGCRAMNVREKNGMFVQPNACNYYRNSYRTQSAITWCRRDRIPPIAKAC
ncbi:hypothetical protein LXA43DRAFT_190377 [Ganoderma leucocontextum]|nr:hypothetical protein LXA43DRAFT_190377 [Ganoderma leucocontextum]